MYFPLTNSRRYQIRTGQLNIKGNSGVWFRVLNTSRGRPPIVSVTTVPLNQNSSANFTTFTLAVDISTMRQNAWFILNGDDVNTTTATVQTVGRWSTLLTPSGYDDDGDGDHGTTTTNNNNSMWMNPMLKIEVLDGDIMNERSQLLFILSTGFGSYVKFDTTNMVETRVSSKDDATIFLLQKGNNTSSDDGYFKSGMGIALTTSIFMIISLLASSSS